jgi:hypothetical protein
MASKLNPNKTLLKTPSLKDELKKRGVSFKSKKESENVFTEKDKLGRSPGSAWYAFNPDTKKYDPSFVGKSKEKITSTKKSVITPAIKKIAPVGTLAPKSTKEIANKSLEKAKTIVPAKTTTTTASTNTSKPSSTTSSTKVTGFQPRATFINRVRGVVNESRERRAGRAASHGNEERSDRLHKKIENTERKMAMKKGGSIKSKTKKK